MMPPKEALKELGRTQLQLAKALGIGQSMVSQMLLGHRPWPGRLIIPACRYLQWKTEPHEINDGLYPKVLSHSMAEEGRFLLAARGELT